MIPTCLRSARRYKLALESADVFRKSEIFSMTYLQYKSTTHLPSKKNKEKSNILQDLPKQDPE